MAERVMYVKPNCPYCEQARAEMTAEGMAFEERDATAERVWRDELMEYSKGTGRVPTVVLAGQVETVGWKGRG